MQRCPQCRGEVERPRRTRLERLFYTSVYRCRACDLRMAMLYPFVERQIIRFKFVFSLHTRCVRCTNVDIRNKRDYVDPLTKSPLGLIQRLLHAPIKHCNRCRLQYYDWRPVRPAPPQKTAANPR